MAMIKADSGPPITEYDALRAVPAAVRGPGWYESSWDLRCGLEVREGLPADVDTHEWLAHHLFGARPVLKPDDAG